MKLLQLPPGEPVVELHRTAYTAEGLVVEGAIGLGSHDLGVADTAVDLYWRGLAPMLLFTGATSPTTRGRMPRGKAVHYRERALELGVPETAVLVEPRARNTGGNIRFSRELLAEAGVPVTSVLLISKPYEERRAYATARKLWPEVEIVSASTPMTYEGYTDSIGDERRIAIGPSPQQQPVQATIAARWVSCTTWV